MIRAFTIAALLATPAMAQQFPAPIGACTLANASGSLGTTEESCVMMGGRWVPYAVTVTTCVTCGPTINHYTPTCPPDRELVQRAGGSYGCAKDVEDAK